MRKTRRGKLRYQKSLIIVVTFSLLLFLSVGYAAFQTSIVLNAKGNIFKCKLGKKWVYNYQNHYQEFTSPCDGTYKFELWGADSFYSVGGYVSGNISLNEKQKFYLYVGEKGHKVDTDAIGGYNGGGNTSISSTSGKSGPTGGGATDVRTISGDYDQFDSLKSRIMVAGGAGGSASQLGSAGGGLNGIDGYVNQESLLPYLGKGGTQIAGGAATPRYTGAATGGEAGTFGIGGNGGRNVANTNAGGGGGGGAGYFGGSGASGIINGSLSSGGGSSFISGHAGCIAIDQISTADNIVFKAINNVSCTETPTIPDCSYHYLGYIFNSTLMIDGTGHKWTTEVDGTMSIPSKINSDGSVDSSGNGHAVITLVSIN